MNQPWKGGTSAQHAAEGEVLGKWKIKLGPGRGDR